MDRPLDRQRPTRPLRLWGKPRAATAMPDAMEPPVAGRQEAGLDKRRFFAEAPIAIALADPSLRLIEANPAMGRLVGADPASLAGRMLGELLMPGSEAVLADLAALAPGAEPPAQAPEVRLAGRREAMAQVFAQRGDGGDASGDLLILHFFETTEQKRLETQFAQSQKMQAVGQLAGGIAHDFNNLLTAMIGFCDLLLMRHKPGDSSFGDIMQIKQNGNRAANLVRQLLAFSRQQTLQPRVLDVTDVLTELLHLLRRLIGENIELSMIHGRELGLVKVDQGQLEQVLINLCVNARDAMKGGGKLSIRTTNLVNAEPLARGTDEMPPGQWVVIEVQDTGCGIPADNIQRIFEPFFSTKEVGSGTGLGLSTVYGIVRQTGGYVAVESTVGKGSLFCISLPRHSEAELPASAAAQPDAPQAASPDLTGIGRILLVEDEDAVRMFSARALRNKGYKVWEASSGEAALDIFAREGEIDLLITDVIMPNLDGPGLVARVKPERPELKVIFMSGYTEDRFREQLSLEGDTEFLAKPFTLKQLAAKVKDVMAPA